MLLEDHAGDPSYHASLPRLILNPLVESRPRRPPWAWQIAHASASAASEEGEPVSLSRRFTMCCTCSLLAWPLPTTACLTCSAVYSTTGSPASTAAQIAVPRACPRASVEAGLALTKTFSTTICCGRCFSITSRRFERIVPSRSGRPEFPDLMQPLAT